MTTTLLGTIAGVALAIAILVGGWGGFLLALVLGLGGALVGGQLAGEIDLRGVTRGRQRV
jgi:uncharacterized membrane protein YeaQ/YmgE (transglycosylase-associated protein family)